MAVASFFRATCVGRSALIVQVFRKSDEQGIGSGLVAALFLAVWVSEPLWGVGRLDELSSVS